MNDTHLEDVRRDARCGECRGRLIGSEIERGMCGHCTLRLFRGVFS